MSSSPSPLRSYAHHYRTNILLAMPVMFSQAGHMVVQITDNIMVGRLGATSLAASSFAHNVFIGGLLFGIGFSAAMTPLVGAAHGKGDTDEAASWFKNGLVANLSLGLVMTLVMCVIGLFMDKMGQSPEVVRLARPVYFLWTLSILPTLVFMSFKQFSEGIGNTRIAAMITFQEILVNVGLNYVLIYGKLGFPALGVVGSGWATLMARISMPITFAFIVADHSDFRPFLSALPRVKVDATKVIRYARLGFPLAGQTILEVMAFALGAIMMGWLGPLELASHQIAIGLAALTFMGATGIAAAATIKVSQYFGAGDRANMRRAAFASMHIVLVYEAVTALLFVLLRQYLPMLYVNDLAVIGIAAKLLMLAAVFQLVDGLQVVALGSLRGLADARTPTVIAFVAYMLMSLPVSYGAAFGLGWREMGIWTGYVVGLTAASVLYVGRFAVRSKTMKVEGVGGS
jgi:MATE family multidrug resistance protein